MNQKIKLLGIGSLVLTLLSFSDTAFACTCMKAPTPCVAYERAGAVFIGTPTDVSRNESKDRIFRFSVDQAFRGVNNSQLSVITGQDGGDCGYSFKIGEQYLVYAHRGKDQKTLFTDICTRTNPVRDADEDLEYIHALSKALPGGWVFGEVFKTYRSHGVSPLEGFKVTIVGQGKSVTVMTDKYGRFRASSLPAGNYKVRVSPPEGLSERNNESVVKVADRGCATVEFWLQVDERVK